MHLQTPSLSKIRFSTNDQRDKRPFRTLLNYLLDVEFNTLQKGYYGIDVPTELVRRGILVLCIHYFHNYFGEQKSNLMPS